MRVGIVTVSDSTFGVDRQDTSGESIADWCVARGYTVAVRKHVTDETSRIVPVLAEMCDADAVDLILTTGGTGLARRDVTPEATRAVIEREAQGIADYLRQASTPNFPRAALSRGLAGTRGSTLIVNLPGSTKGVHESLAALEAVVDHAVDVLSGAVTRHDAGSKA